MTELFVIAGPTASGKSALAVRLAEAVGGMIVNADSMQLYRELCILTARPTPAEEARVPHRLYGVLDAEDPASAGRWLALAGAALAEARTQGRSAIVVGGTGLYLHALLDGLAPVPSVPAAARRAARVRLAELGAAGLHAELARLDPATAARLRPTDAQRVTRAYEVIVGTGRSLAGWQEMPPRRLELPPRWTGIALMPPRAALYERIERRLREMIDAGALAEVAELRRRGLDPDLPLMKAAAVPELLAHLEGRIDLATATQRAIVQTRRYAKRQITWLRHRLPELRRIETFGEAARLPTAAFGGRC